MSSTAIRNLVEVSRRVRGLDQTQPGTTTLNMTFVSVQRALDAKQAIDATAHPGQSKEAQIQTKPQPLTIVETAKPSA